MFEVRARGLRVFRGVLVPEGVRVLLLAAASLVHYTLILCIPISYIYIYIYEPYKASLGFISSLRRVWEFRVC